MLTCFCSYLLFKISPYSKKIIGMTKKAPKYYFFDVPRVQNEAARLENFVALSLLTEIHLKNELNGEDYSLHYLRNKNGHEIDFLICKDKTPNMMIEVKTSDANPSKSFSAFDSALKKQNPKIKKIQLVKNLEKPFSTRDGIHVENLGKWLEKISF